MKDSCTCLLLSPHLASASSATGPISLDHDAHTLLRRCRAHPCARYQLVWMRPSTPVANAGVCRQRQAHMSPSSWPGQHVCCFRVLNARLFLPTSDVRICCQHSLYIFSNLVCHRIWWPPVLPEPCLELIDNFLQWRHHACDALLR